MVYKFFDKRTSGSGTKSMSNQQLAKELADEKKKNIFITCNIWGNIWGTDLADMQLVRKFNKGISFLFCVFDIFRKYAWVVPLKNKEGVTTVNAFQKI